MCTLINLTLIKPMGRRRVNSKKLSTRHRVSEAEKCCRADGLTLVSVFTSQGVTRRSYFIEVSSQKLFHRSYLAKIVP